MRSLVSALITLCLLIPFINLTRLTPESEERLTVELREAERRFTASAETGDAEALESLLTDDVRIVRSNGDQLDHGQALAAVHSRQGLGLPLQNPDTRLYDRLALLHGRAVTAGKHEYVLRAWVRAGDTWRLAIEHATDITEHATADPPAFAALPERVAAHPTDDVGEGEADVADVKDALRESHERYWAKDVQAYKLTLGADLVRAAETGVRPGTELVTFMRTSPHLPREPPHQLDMWADVFGNVALAGWLDVGTTPSGASSRNRFTLALVWRDGRWQIVQIHSTGVAVSPSTRGARRRPGRIAREEAADDAARQAERAGRPG